MHFLRIEGIIEGIAGASDDGYLWGSVYVDVETGVEYLVKYCEKSVMVQPRYGPDGKVVVASQWEIERAMQAQQARKDAESEAKMRSTPRYI